MSQETISQDLATVTEIDGQTVSNIDYSAVNATQELATKLGVNLDEVRAGLKGEVYAEGDRQKEPETAQAIESTDVEGDRQEEASAHTQDTTPTAEEVANNEEQPTEPDAARGSQGSEETSDHDPAFTEFSSNFEKYMGVKLQDAYDLMQELSDFRNQYYMSQQQGELRSSWGNEYENRMQMVAEKFQTLPKPQQLALDNVDGAKLLWALIEQEQRQGRPNVPHFDRGRTTGGTSAPNYKYSEIMKMSREEYDRNYPQIAQAFAQKRVLMDI